MDINADDPDIYLNNNINEERRRSDISVQTSDEPISYGKLFFKVTAFLQHTLDWVTLFQYSSKFLFTVSLRKYIANS